MTGHHRRHLCRSRRCFCRSRWRVLTQLIHSSQSLISNDSRLCKRLANCGTFSRQNMDLLQPRPLVQPTANNRIHESELCSHGNAHNYYIVIQYRINRFRFPNLGGAVQRTVANPRSPESMLPIWCSSRAVCGLAPPATSHPP